MHVVANVNNCQSPSKTRGRGNETKANDRIVNKRTRSADDKRTRKNSNKRCKVDNTTTQAGDEAAETQFLEGPRILNMSVSGGVKDQSNKTIEQTETESEMSDDDEVVLAHLRMKPTVPLLRMMMIQRKLNRKEARHRLKCQ